MVNVVFGRENVDYKNFVIDVRPYFMDRKRPEWFNDEFIKRVVKGIDGADVLFEEALKSKYGHGMSTAMLSTGCKVLCCLYFDTEDTIFFASQMGDNCIPFYAELARSRNFTLCYEHYADIPEWCFKENLFYYKGRPLTQLEYDNLFSDWSYSDEVEDY